MASTTSAEVTSVVPDASVAAKWYFDDEVHTEQARALRTQFAQGKTSFLVPDCFFYEVLGVVRTAERRTPPRISAARADEIVAELIALVVEVIDSRPLFGRALELSRSLEVAPYDALYLAVAERAAATFVTADQRLYDRTQHLSHVKWLGDL